MNNGPEAEFWAFSLELYALPQVAAAALHLQDVGGKNVNLALYCLFAGMVGGQRLDGNALDRLAQAIGPWNDTVVEPLRRIRRALRPLDTDPDIAQFRQRVQELELGAEKLVQRRLIGATHLQDNTAGSLDIARDNLIGYAGDEALPLFAAIRAAFAGET